jgi:hypothetical protein
MKPPSLHEDDWDYVRTLFPADLEDSAYRQGALLRTRNITDAESFLRIALAYAVSDLSLKDLAAWATALGLATISGPGLFYRLRQAEDWLEQVLGQVLNDHLAEAAGGLRLRVVDATVINGPGQKAVQWRAHVSIDPATGKIRSVELTDDSGGEKLGRYHFAEGQVVLGDRAYGTARGLHAVREQGAHAVVRFNPASLRTYDDKRRRVYLAEKESEVPKVGVVEFSLTIPVPPPRTRSHKIWNTAKAIAWVSARAIAARTRTGEVTWVITTLPARQMPAVGILGLYRVRWQIELLFKRLKSLLHLDTLPSREGPTAKSWILSRLIAAALAQKLVQPAGSLSPWGYELRAVRSDRGAQQPAHA